MTPGFIFLGALKIKDMPALVQIFRRAISEVFVAQILPDASWIVVVYKNDDGRLHFGFFHATAVLLTNEAYLDKLFKRGDSFNPP